MKTIIVWMLAIIVTFAKECQYDVEDIVVKWSAYKTPLKVAVSGTFKEIEISTNPNKTVDTLLKGVKVTIDTANIDSKNSERDAKLVKFFFNIQNVKSIGAKIKSLDQEIVNTEIRMNGISKIIPMKMRRKNNHIEAEGYIDLEDFDMIHSLKSINKACYELHKGKTWQDIKIAFDIQIKKQCK